MQRQGKPPLPCPTHRISFISLSPLPRNYSLLSTTRFQETEQPTERDQTQNQNSPGDLLANPATDRDCLLFPPPPPPMGSADRSEVHASGSILCFSFSLAPCSAIVWLTSPLCVLLLQIDGIVVAEKGARSCVECRATTTPMWRSGPTGPRVSSL